MHEIFTQGRFEVEQGNEQAFVDAWSEFAAWTSTRPGADTLRLVRDTRNTRRFFSVGRWEDADAIRSWKSAAEFKERLGLVVRQATEFEPTELVTLVRVTDGTVEAVAPPEQIEAIHAPS
jgi:heme-degrading monooxygenase HmoA